MKHRNRMVAAVCIALLTCVLALTTDARSDGIETSLVGLAGLTGLAGVTPSKCCCDPSPAAEDATSCGCCGEDGESAPGEPCLPGAPCECSDGGGGMPPMAPAPIVEMPIARQPEPMARPAWSVWPLRSNWHSLVEGEAATGPPIRLRICVWLI